jgi:2,4-dienoyl-CoA reductase (NADPH2)
VAERLAADHDAVVVATGIRPRRPQLPGIDHPRVLSYVDVLRGAAVGRRVAIVGAGGIGFDVAEFLSHDDSSGAADAIEAFAHEWGIDMSLRRPGGLVAAPAGTTPPRREIWLLQRKPGRPGATLGKTTGWIHRTQLKRRGVQMIGGVAYDRIDDDGFHVTIDGRQRVLPVDHVVICAGQEPLRDLVAPLQSRGIETHLIGGADLAAELDAKRAIDQGARVAAAL